MRINFSHQIGKKYCENFLDDINYLIIELLDQHHNNYKSYLPWISILTATSIIVFLSNNSLLTTTCKHKFVTEKVQVYLQTSSK